MKLKDYEKQKIKNAWYTDDTIVIDRESYWVEIVTLNDLSGDRWVYVYDKKTRDRRMPEFPKMCYSNKVNTYDECIKYLNEFDYSYCYY